jgi:hypothetical protein
LVKVPLPHRQRSSLVGAGSANSFLNSGIHVPIVLR